MGTLMLLETLLGVINSLSANDNPNRIRRSSTASVPTGTPSAVATGVSASDEMQNDAPMAGSQPGDATQADPAYAQQQPAFTTSQPQTSDRQSPRTEQDLRNELDQVDLYDLSGEKAAAEALRRDDEFKQQQIDAKAEQTKEFFAEQDRKQQETVQAVQAQAEQRLEEARQKEFWDTKQADEMQAGMQSELRSLHEAARQEQLQWRAGFTEGVCRDDATATINNQIEDRVGAYRERLDDIGANPGDAAATAEQYKVKLQEESAGQIEQRTAELHQEHFPEYQGIKPAGPTGPGLGEIQMKGFGPFEAGPQGGYGLEGLVNKNADGGPWEQVTAPAPDKPFMRAEYDPRGDGTDAPEDWFKNPDELPKQNAPAGWFKDVDAPPADGKDVPDGWMKPIDPSLRERVSGAMDSAASATAEAMDKVKTTAGEAIDSARATAADAMDKAKVAASQAIDATRTATTEVMGAVKIASAEAMTTAKSQIADSIDGYKTAAVSVKNEAVEVASWVRDGAQDLHAAVIQRANDLHQDVQQSIANYNSRVEAVAQQMQPAPASAPTPDFSPTATPTPAPTPTPTPTQTLS